LAQWGKHRVPPPTLAPYFFKNHQPAVFGAEYCRPQAGTLNAI
jgi:hypothetical protein